MNRGDIKQAYARAVAHDVPDVADMLLKLTDRIDQVEKQLWHEQNLPFRNQLNETQRRLEESQAREVTLREALKMAAPYMRHDALRWQNDWRSSDSAVREAKEKELKCGEYAGLLNQPTDDTALREMIERAGKVMRERCWQTAQPEDSHQDEWFKAKADSCARIRALPEVTLEDLK